MTSKLLWFPYTYHWSRLAVFCFYSTEDSEAIQRKFSALSSTTLLLSSSKIYLASIIRVAWFVYLNEETRSFYSLSDLPWQLRYNLILSHKFTRSYKVFSKGMGTQLSRWMFVPWGPVCMPNTQVEKLGMGMLTRNRSTGESEAHRFLMHACQHPSLIRSPRPHWKTLH